jgi:hypothetical protein
MCLIEYGHGFSWRCGIRGRGARFNGKREKAVPRSGTEVGSPALQGGVGIWTRWECRRHDSIRGCGERPVVPMALWVVNGCLPRVETRGFRLSPASGLEGGECGHGLAPGRKSPPGQQKAGWATRLKIYCRSESRVGHPPFYSPTHGYLISRMRTFCLTTP